MSDKSIHYRIGKGEFDKFYDTPFIKEGEHLYVVEFYNWEPSSFGFLDKNGEKIKSLGAGTLIESKFDTDTKKLDYIRGRLDSYSVTIKDDFISVSWANSKGSMDRFTKWVMDVLRNKFGLAHYSIETKTLHTYIPNVNIFEIKANEEIIQFLTGK